MLLEEPEKAEKLLVIIFDKEKQRIIECLFFNTLEECHSASKSILPLYSDKYAIFKLPVTIDACIDTRKTEAYGTK